ncbi:MAG: 50S ribosomal protein L25 [Planctomycetota bacterium]
MHENAPVLKGTQRERKGTRYARRDREQGRLPAIVYGHGQDPLAVALEARDTIGHIAKGEKVFKLKIEGVGDELVLLRDLQYDYLGTNLVHADFSRVDLAEKVTAHVHVVLKGDAKGLKSAGTVLTHPITELTVECAISALPDQIEVNIEDLDVHGTVFAKDVVLPEGVTLTGDPDGVVAHVVGGKGGDDAEDSDEAAAPGA